MIEHPVLEPSVQKRVVVLYLLYHFHKHEPITANPHAHVLARVLAVCVLLCFQTTQTNNANAPGSAQR